MNVRTRLQAIRTRFTRKPEYVPSTRTRKDWILWGSLGCALVSTAHAEYTLATAAHFNEYVALAVPGALDLYVVRALQQRRDVFVAVLAMVAANVTSHLIAGGVLGVRWPVIAAVGAVAPLIVWRVYSLKYTRTRQELLWGLDAGAVSAPAEYVPVPLPPLEHGDEYAPSTPSTPSTHVPDPVLDPKYVPSTTPDRVPDWMSDEYPASTAHSNVVQFSKYSSTAVCVAHSRPECAECVLEYGGPSHSLPKLPPEYTPSTVTAPVLELKKGDHAYLPGAQEYLEVQGDEATLRGLMRALAIGQDRAGRLLAHLEAGEES